MIKIFALISCFFIAKNAFSQSISREVVASSGAEASGQGATISWSLGEPIISSSEGYQAPLDIQNIVTLIEEETELHVKVFPNPTFDILNLTLDEFSKSVKVQIFNTSGQKVQEAVQIKNSTIKIDLGSLQPGNYFIQLSGYQKKSKTYKIVKL